MRYLVSLNCIEAQQAVMTARTSNPRWSPASACHRLPDAWGEFLALHAACLAALQDGNRAEAYDRSIAALQPFLRAFREDEGAWVIHPMHSVVHNMRAAAEAADAEARAAGRRGDKLADCGDQLRKCFSVSLQAPSNREKKLAALDIVNVSIKIYFKLNTIRLCKNLMRTVDSRQFAPFESFPASQRVTYMFYKGRLAVFDENYVSECSLLYVVHCQSVVRHGPLVVATAATKIASGLF
jgi:nuclear mRNA export protein PCID2/THP1